MPAGPAAPENAAPTNDSDTFMRSSKSILAGLVVVVASSSGAALVAAAEPTLFRTDADGPYKPDELKKLGGKNAAEVRRWYRLEPGRFPPAGSAHAVSGELMYVDHLERRFQLRVDRNDGQDRAVWDLPLDAVMLPFGSIMYHGAPAALQDVPLGTHLHGLFYLRADDDRTPPPDTANYRRTPEADFRRCFLLEDDFSHHLRQDEQWRIDAVDLAAKKLSATLLRRGEPHGNSKSFDLTTGARVFENDGFVTLASLRSGRTASFNLTWATLYGPGRISDAWLDEASRRGATERQAERHRIHVRERGLAGWVTEVDDVNEIVTVEFFGGVDPALFDEIRIPVSTPGTGGAPPTITSRPGLAVARESLMTYDPVNDRKRGDVLELKRVAIEPGGAGFRIRLKMDMLLEGYRPHRIVRLYPASWPVQALPREEQFFGRE